MKTALSLLLVASLVLTFCSKADQNGEELESTLQVNNEENQLQGNLRATWPKRFVFGTKSHPGDCQGGTTCCTGDRGICLIIEWLSDTVTLEQAISELDTLQGIAELEPHTLDSMNFIILYDMESFDPEEHTVLHVNKDFPFPMEESTLKIKEGQYPLNYGGTYVYGRARLLYEIE